MEKENKKRGMEQMLYTVLGGFLFAFGVNLIIMPMNLYNGGFMGVAQLLRTFVVSVLHIDLGSFDLAGIIYYMINIPLMYLAWKNIGKGFFVRTIISVTLQSVFFNVDSDSEGASHFRHADSVYYRRTYIRPRYGIASSGRKFRRRTGYYRCYLCKEIPGI